MTHIRVLVTAEDGDPEASSALAHVLRDAGMEVVYTGGQLSAEQIVHTGIQEDVDALGVPGELAGAVTDQLQLQDVDDVAVFATDIPLTEAADWVRAHAG